MEVKALVLLGVLGKAQVQPGEEVDTAVDITGLPVPLQAPIRVFKVVLDQGQPYSWASRSHMAVKRPSSSASRASTASGLSESWG